MRRNIEGCEQKLEELGRDLPKDHARLVVALQQQLVELRRQETILVQQAAGGIICGRASVCLLCAR